MDAMKDLVSLKQAPCIGRPKWQNQPFCATLCLIELGTCVTRRLSAAVCNDLPSPVITDVWDRLSWSVLPPDNSCRSGGYISRGKGRKGQETL